MEIINGKIRGGFSCLRKGTFHAEVFVIKWFNQKDTSRFFDCVYRMINRYRRHGVAFSCAALTYYLVFAAFPLLVLLGTLPGALGLESESLLQAVGHFVPQQVTALVGRYWEDAARNGGSKLLWSSAVFSLWLPVRATDCLLQAMRRAFGVVRPKGVKASIRTLLFTLWLMATLLLALLLITVGRRALTYLTVRLGLPVWVAGVWNVLRFALLGLVLTAVLSILYMLALGKRRPLRQVAPGVMLSLAVWMLVSAIFSYYVEHIAGYTLLYGSVTAVVVTLLWLYMSGLVLIMGAEFNAVLHRGRRSEGERKKQP